MSLADFARDLDHCTRAKLEHPESGFSIPTIRVENNRLLLEIVDTRIDRSTTIGWSSFQGWVHLNPERPDNDLLQADWPDEERLPLGDDATPSDIRDMATKLAMNQRMQKQPDELRNALNSTTGPRLAKRIVERLLAVHQPDWDPQLLAYICEECVDAYVGPAFWPCPEVRVMHSVLDDEQQETTR